MAEQSTDKHHPLDCSHNKGKDIPSLEKEGFHHIKLVGIDQSNNNKKFKKQQLITVNRTTGKVNYFNFNNGDNIEVILFQSLN
jgi:hypothetical protein